MASKRRVRRKQCSRKMRYDRDQAAAMAAKAYHRTGGEKIRAYHCGHCGQWHIGHRRAA